MNPLFVTGIGTDIGKTLISAILVEKLQADYWKPVQSGDLDNSDTMKVQRLVSNPRTVFHPEGYRLTHACSPHQSAAMDGVQIEPGRIRLPKTRNSLIVEGAGGLMVPLNDECLIIDLIKELKAEVVLVSRNYLGSINHTLLSAEALNHRNIRVKGIIFNGNKNEATEQYILKYTNYALLGRIPHMPDISPQTVLNATAWISL